MRILYIDIDTLRADHLGCYGYHRNTSPNIDQLADQALRFENVYASDTPCLPSRSALLTGRFGIRNGVVNHGGTDADPVLGGVDRLFHSELHATSLPRRFQQIGMRTVSISSFAQRHSAFHWYAGFDEAYNVGKFGMETADEVHAITADWLARKGTEDDWFLHVHMWDPHTPYRAAAEYGEPFAADPIPGWLTESVRARDWQGCGPHSAQECCGFTPNDGARSLFPRQPQQIESMAAVRAMFDGYDTGVLVADEFAGRLFNQLADLGVLEDTAIIVSSDHGETLGELNVYGDHQTADECTSHVPMIVKWPGMTPAVDDGFHYQIDVFASLLELAGGQPSRNWDAVSFAGALAAGNPSSREYLVVSQGAWTCQRSVRFDNYLCMKTLHDGFHLYPDIMLFDLQVDPHEQHNLAAERPEVARNGLALLDAWHAELLPRAARGRDPLQNVITEGGPFHIRNQLDGYLKRLRATGRKEHANRLEEVYK